MTTSTLPLRRLITQTAKVESGMDFPEAKRVVYSKNPLAEVIVQLQFAPILKIDSEPPAAFQDLIRLEYPRYSLAAANNPIPANAPPQIRNVIQSMGFRSGPARHLFEAEDRHWQVALTRQTLELRTRVYRRWEEFCERGHKLRVAFEQTYKPGFYVRLGLRYVDVIRRSLLNLADVPWSELLNPYVAGELSAPELATRIDAVSRELHCSLEGNNCYLTLRTGIAQTDPDKEPCFLIDSDFHTHKRTEIADVENILDTFNRASGRLFRWSIKPRLHDALEPQPVD
jgi:uncharacterized protein (TIGR04255 family)